MKFYETNNCKWIRDNDREISTFQKGGFEYAQHGKRIQLIGRMCKRWLQCTEAEETK